MTFDFRYPQLTGATEKEQLQQLKTYMHQLVDELKWALNSVGSPQNNVVVIQQKQSNANSGISTIGMDELDDDSVQAHFNEIKPLIIKSADIVNAYYEAINKRLESLYVAQSEFGTFVQKATQDIKATSTDITQQFENIQTVITEIGGNLGTLEEDLLDISEEFGYTQQNIHNINSNIETIDGEIEALGGSVYELDTEIKSVGETVGAIDSELKTVGGKVVEHDTEIEEVKTGVQSVETDLNDTKVGIGSSLESISEEVGVIDKDLQGVKAGVESGIKDLSDEVGKVDSKIEDAKSAINSDLDKLKDSLKDLSLTLIEVNAHIKSGLLYYENEIPVYGLEIGQKNTINGVETFNKFARFCAGKLSFYDNNGTEVAYISDYKLYITHAEVTGTLKLGGYLVDTSRGVTFKWVGRS